MQTITIELKNDNSLKELKELEDRDLIRIVEEPSFDSYSMKGEAMTEDDFKRWVEYSEDSPTVDYSEAKAKWQEQKKKLQKLIR